MAFIQFYLGRNMPPLEGSTFHHALPFSKTSTSTSGRRNDGYCNVSPLNSVSLGVQETTSTLACAKILGKNCTEYVDEYGDIIEKNHATTKLRANWGHTKEPRHESDICSIEICFPISRKVLPKLPSGRLGAQEELEVEMTCHD